MGPEKMFKQVTITYNTDKRINHTVKWYEKNNLRSKN